MKEINAERLERDLATALTTGWERVKVSSHKEVYASLFDWLNQSGFYETMYRKSIPNPAYDNGAKDLGREFLQILRLYELSPDNIFPGSFAKSIEIENVDTEERVFEMYLTRGNTRVYKIILRFPHSHETFEFTQPPSIELSIVSTPNARHLDILALKNADTPYRLFKKNLLLYEDDQMWIFSSNIGCEIVNYPSEKIWVTNCNAFIIVPKNEHYNVVIMERAEMLEYYVNLITSPIEHAGVIEYIDMDIDVTFTSKDYDPVVLDEEEFIQHASKYNYSEELIEKIKVSTEKLTQRVLNKEYLFSTAFYNYCKVLREHA
jgi:protein associated with RNAse G/E